MTICFGHVGLLLFNQSIVKLITALVIYTRKINPFENYKIEATGIVRANLYEKKKQR